MGEARYKPYPEYKASGVEWLGDIPEGWGRAPLKYMALEATSLFLDGDWIESKDISEDGVRYITTGNVGEGFYREQGEGFITEETFKKLNATEVFENDILISRLNVPIGRACIVPGLNSRIVTSVDNVIFRPDSEFDRPFVVYMLSSKEYFTHTSNMARGATMQRISRGLLGNIRLIFPPILEQTQIAAFLDHETAKIDALIAKQQRLFALLEEKRQAVISHAVTKGLDSAAPMRPSGIDWLGDVPKHWNRRSIRRLFSQTKRQGFAELEVLSVYRDFGVIKKSSRDDNFNKTPTDLSSYQLVEVGDLVVNKMKAWQGSLGVSRHHGITSPDYIVFESHHDEDPLFLHFALRSKAMPDVYRSISNGIRPSQWRLEPEEFGKLEIYLPPSEEQAKIVSHIQNNELLTDRLKERAKSAITLLKERRYALISAAVTGKIDVRDWQLPQTVPDQDILQDA